MAGVAVMLVSTGCMVGSKYFRPAAPMPASDVFKEAESCRLRDSTPERRASRSALYRLTVGPSLKSGI